MTWTNQNTLYYHNSSNDNIRHLQRQEKINSENNQLPKEHRQLIRKNFSYSNQMYKRQINLHTNIHQTFPNNLLFLAPTPSLSLLHFQSQLCDAIRKEGIEIAHEFAFNSWIPYCSVAHHVPQNRMPEAFSLLRELKLPVSGYAMDVALVQFSPVREIFSFVLGNNVDSWPTVFFYYSIVANFFFVVLN